MQPRGSLAGRTLVGRYEVLDRIGAGGMGEVYRARDRELDDLIAVKVVRQDLVAVPEALERFRTEVKLARRVTHRNVARAYELVVSDEVTFYTMELVDGVPLTQRMAGGRRLGVAEAASIAGAVCDALSAAHSAGIVHRDVKPENILLAHDGRVVLADFGIAAAVQGGTGELAGTPRYMAPEQASGDDPTPAVDVFSLGVVLYEMLTGRPAYPSADLAELVQASQRTEQLELDGFDPRLRDLVARATARDPAARLHTAAAFRRALEPFIRHEPADRASSTSLRRAAPLPTIVVRCDPGEADQAHIVEGFRQAFVDRLAEWPRLRVSTRANPIADGIVEIALRDLELELKALIRPQSLSLVLPFGAESVYRSADRAARVIAAMTGSDAAPPPVRDATIPSPALELVLRARHVVRRDRSRLAEAVTWCEEALELAPNHPRVEATLATCQAQLSFYARRPAATLLDAAARHAFAALATDPHLADAHFARAHVELHRGRPTIAAACFRAAIARAPLMAEAHEWLGRMLLEAGFADDAQARLDDAISHDHLPALRWDIVFSLALVDRWDEVDRLLPELRGLGAHGGRGHRLRLASWRGLTELDTYAELAALPDGDTFERPFLLAIYDPAKPWPARRNKILQMVDSSELVSARRRAFLAQLAAETAGLAGDVDACLALVLRANACGLFDVPWLDRCPALATVREEPRFAIIRNDVAARADAIHDALFDDHRDQATMNTALPG